MKKYALLIIGLWVSLIGFAGNQPIDPVIKKLNHLLQEESFLELRSELQKLPRSFSHNTFLYYDAYCYSAFGQYNQSIVAINQLLNQYRNKLSNQEVVHLLEQQGLNYNNTFQYHLAAQVYSTLLEDFSHLLTKSKSNDYNTLFKINYTLAKALVGKQKLHITKDTTIPIYNNIFNHLMIPVSSKGVHDHFIFDTGAQTSTISHSEAKRLGFKIYETDINVSTATHIQIKTKIGVADSLYVGELLFENVVFLIAEDNDLFFPELDYQISGIIGYPLIKQMQEIKIDLTHNALHIPLKPSSRKYSNLYLKGQTPVVIVETPQDTLKMALDTGAKSSELSVNYFNRHKEEIVAKSQLETVGRGGAGGTIHEEVYVYPHFQYKIGSKENYLPQISVNQNEYQFLKGLDGNLGQDVFTQYNLAIINFKSMFIDFE
ncbi:hypothetical protein Bcop_1748 [Bacteroides coprosuis DSM 18011]|uniref:Peptidase A2 domain-containing protein n=1 Tax=Bacteroides coprosuis DSM 18011 TaxID=679937 RepID=F3ZRD1_9BACE|nr:retropepsin-like aspartic protease [Bacteroides coprosuis]EGJ71939.1 hypothetical protein Bcop_1748 [Bacteroides coprosuis DSM 18011]